MSEQSIPAYQFLRELLKFPPENALPIYCQFLEPPDAEGNKWRWKGTPVNVDAFKRKRQLGGNAYITVSAFSGDRRRKSDFVCLLAVMIDDPGTKVDLDKLKMEPTIWLETSPGNFQAWYLLSVPVTDRKTAEGVLKALIDSGLTDDGKDPGMAGVTRYGRVPGGYNNKTSLGQEWAVKATWGKGKRRYTIEEICEGFDITPAEVTEGDRQQDMNASDAETLFCVYSDPVGRHIYDQGLVKDVVSGAVTITCPWIGEHTGGQDDGTALIVNQDGSIGFKCHHGHCQDKGLKDVWAWAREGGLVEQVRENAEDWEPSSAIDLWQQVREALAADDSKRAIAQLKLDNPAQRYAIEEAERLEEAKTVDAYERENAFKRLNDSYPKKLDLAKLLTGDGGALAEAIRKHAESMPTANEYIFTPMIPALASQMGTRQRLIVNASSGHIETAIFWSMVIGETGDKKSPALKAAVDALNALEIEAKDEYDKALKEHYKLEALAKSAKGEVEPPEPPKEKRYVLIDSTAASRTPIHRDNPVGLFTYYDEASRYLEELNKNSRGKDDGELAAMLTEFNGSFSSTDRKGTNGKAERTAIARTAVQRTGTTQWATLGKLMGDHSDDRGLWARWLFCAIPAPIPYVSNLPDYGPTQLTPLMIELVSRIEALPDGDYEYAKDVKPKVNQFVDALVDAGRNADEDAEKGAYPKFITYFHRLALFFHVLNAALEDLPVVPTEIPMSTVKQARHCLEFFVGQFQDVMNRNSPERKVTGDGVMLMAYIAKRGNALLRDIQRSNCLRKRGVTRAGDYRSRLALLAEAGKIVEKDGCYSIAE